MRRKDVLVFFVLKTVVLIRVGHLVGWILHDLRTIVQALINQQRHLYRR